MSKEQVLDKGIRQKSTKRVNSFIVCSAFCPGPPNRDPMDSEKRLRVHTSQAPQWHAMHGVLTSLPSTYTEIGMHVYKSSDYQWVKFVHVCTASNANWLRSVYECKSEMKFMTSTTIIKDNFIVYIHTQLFSLQSM